MRTLFSATLMVASLALTGARTPVFAQSPDRVLVRSLDRGPAGERSWDQGMLGLWHRVRKVGNTASVLYTAAHPDDEQAGVLTLLSRGEGVRTGLLTLNRGEGGANAIGPELFDALGLIRSEELRLAGRYYGLDDQYFTTAADYGYSKTLDEALRSWDREAVLEDMVRVIRLNRPLVVVSRWHGSRRDGHGHHQASGVLTAEAAEAAGDPRRFPDQIRAEGLRPWTPRKVYRSRLTVDEHAHVVLDPGVTDPLLGQSYEEIGRYGLSLQRSQTSGRMRGGAGSAPARFERLRPSGPEREESFFDGLDTSLPGVFGLVGEPAPPLVVAKLAGIQLELDRLHESTSLEATGFARRLTTAVFGLRDVVEGLDPDSDAAFILRIELAEAESALAAAQGVEVRAVATARGAAPTSPLGAVVAGRDLDVHVTVHARMGRTVSVREVSLAGDGWSSPPPGESFNVEPDAVQTRVLATRVPSDAEPTRPWFTRGSIAENIYAVRDSSELHLGEARPKLMATVTIALGGGRSSADDPALVLLTVRTPVTTIESAAPYGSVERPLIVAPRLSVSVDAGARIVPASEPGRPFTLDAAVVSNDPEPVDAVLSLDLPDGWRSEPAEHAALLERPGERAAARFTVHPDTAAGGRGPWDVTAVATAGGQRFTHGLETIRHRDLQLRLLDRPARTTVARVDATVRAGLRVGYVMGVGDDVPAAIAELGADVVLLTDADLGERDLSAFDAVVVGTRAYAVRPALATANARLRSYMEAGGHLVVLYQTPEYRADLLAPHPADLPRNAEEVSEEDAPVELLAPEHPLLSDPNRITTADFDGWIEQRGSKFFAAWSADYTPLVETHDTGQEPQEGVWLSAPVGAGHFTYVALALHRQLPYAVPGAYRILANLISLGR